MLARCIVCVLSLRRSGRAGGEEVIWQLAVYHMAEEEAAKSRGRREGEKRRVEAGKEKRGSR